MHALKVLIGPLVVADWVVELEIVCVSLLFL